MHKFLSAGPFYHHLFFHLSSVFLDLYLLLPLLYRRLKQNYTLVLDMTFFRCDNVYTILAYARKHHLSKAMTGTKVSVTSTSESRAWL